MNLFRIGCVALIAFALSSFFQPARADVRIVRPSQSLPPVAAYPLVGIGTAIEGSYIIVLAAKDNGPDTVATYAALLYRRNLSDGKWVFLKTLVTANGALPRIEVRMKSGLAAVQIGGQISLFEHVNGDYVPARTAAPIRHPGGIAISANQLLVGGDGCTYDGVVYTKGTNGVWDITGRLDDHTGECDSDGTAVELNYGYALLRTQTGGDAHAWRRNGTAFDWVPAGTLAMPSGVIGTDLPYTLQYSTAVSSSGYVFLRSGTGSWNLQGRAFPIDDDAFEGVTFKAVYREGVLVTTESGAAGGYPRVYLESSPGHFEHVASLFTTNISSGDDVSANTVVATVRDYSPNGAHVEVLDLPTPLRVPNPIVADFEDGDVSDFQIRGGQWQLAARGTNDIWAQGSVSGRGIALATQSDWSGYEAIEAAVTPTFGTGDGWAGLITRYVDADNYYFGIVRANGTFGIYKRVNGVETLLHQGTTPQTPTHRVQFNVDGNTLNLYVDGSNVSLTTDDSLTHGRAGLLTWRVRADFDDVHVAANGPYAVFIRDWGPYGDTQSVDLATLGGDWQVLRESERGMPQGLAQLDKSGDARAFIGVPIANQELVAQMRVDSFGTSSQGAWFGLLARYVDPRNHYYLTVRDTGQIQIRKIVNGAITLLGSANFTAVPGQYYEIRFRVINDQLQAYVDGQLLVSVHDTAIAKGQYGLATYRTAATWQTLQVSQP